LRDPLERLFHRLVTNVAALEPAALERAFPIADIVDRLVPYRTHRASLGFDTNEDYELTVLRLLAGERGYARVQPEEVREAFAREVASPNPEPELFRQFPDATVLLDPDQVAVVLEESARDAEAAGADQPVAAFDADLPAPRTPGGVTYPHHGPRTPAFEAVEPEDLGVEERTEPQLPFELEEPEGTAPEARPREVAASAPCPYCGGTLPVGRTVLFCPHCGQNIGVVHCPTCGAELDVGWRFCVACGQRVTGLG
jgi:hypothetical protein